MTLGLLDRARAAARPQVTGSVLNSQRCRIGALAEEDTALPGTESSTSPRATAFRQTWRYMSDHSPIGPLRKASFRAGSCGSADISDRVAAPSGPLTAATSPRSSSRRSPSSEPVSGTGIDISLSSATASATRSDLVRQRR